MNHRVLPLAIASLAASCAALLQAAEPFFPGATYDAAITHPDRILGFETGTRPANHAQIEACMKAWASTPRSRVFEYARSHEGKALYYLVISSARNIARLDTLAKELAALADPRMVSTAEGDRLAEVLPAVAWMAYVIHGDEVSGSDASLVMAHHLIASTDPNVESLLENVVVIVDPLMNPDGRDRYLSQLAHDRTTQPNVDDQSVLHSRPWPAGRTNHYLFDMNRDWILGTQPESRGRIAAIGAWHPHLLMESHEMGSQDTFLFSPPREPVNPNLAPTMRKWWDVFGNDLARSFDAHNWRYYHGEWNEEWYPGYSSAWAGYRGCIDILFEQASIATDGVRKASGVIETYRESVHHQLVGSMSNIQTLARHRQEILKDYLAQRRYAVSADSAFANRTFAIPASANTSRLRDLVDLLRLQGFELFVSQHELTASGKDQLGQAAENLKLPPGTILIPNRQPEARLLAAMLEFDTRMTPEFLQEERRELLRFGRSRLYDITGWSITMLHDIPAYELSLALPADATPYTPPATAPLNLPTATPTAWLIDGHDDASVAAAAQLMERGVTCRVINKPTILGTTRLSRGSIVIAQADNALPASDLLTHLRAVAEQTGIEPIAATTGLGAGDAPDIGGEHFVLLSRPRIAIMTREPIETYAFGEAWHQIDHSLRIPVTNLDATGLKQGADLRRYNVLVVPTGGGSVIKEHLESIKAWVSSGGTLVAMADAAAAVATETSGLGSTRLLSDVVTKLEPFAAAISREWEGLHGTIDPTSVWAHTAPSVITFPWAAAEEPVKPSEDEAKRRDQWRSLFMPTGAIVASRVDDRHWLTAGCRDFLPVIARQGPVLMSAQGAEAPVRHGLYIPTPKAAAAGKAESSPATKPADSKEVSKADAESAPKPPQPTHWAMMPPDQELRMRMSGLLWPEASERLAHSAYVTVERVGSGQVILFADTPNFRGASKGTMRLFSNAVVFGPGMGASPAVPRRHHAE